MFFFYFSDKMYLYDVHASWVILKGFCDVIKITLSSFISKQIYFGIWANSIPLVMNQRWDAYISKQLMERGELYIFFLLRLQPLDNLEDLLYTNLEWKCSILDRMRSFEVGLGMNLVFGTETSCYFGKFYSSL